VTDTARVLYDFWSSFGIPAYVEHCVPDDAAMPYITYTLNEPVWRDTASLTARVWYRSTSFAGLAAMVDSISRAIGGGLTIPFDGGFIALFKDTNFAQYIGDESDDGMVKCVYLSLVAHVVEE